MTMREDLGLAGSDGATDGAHGDGHGEFVVSAGSTRRRFGFGFLVLSAVVLVAIASLWSMRAIGLSAADASMQSDAGKLVEAFLQERTPRAVQADEAAGAKAAASASAEQVRSLSIPRRLLARNPFEPRLAAAQPAEQAPSAPGNSLSDAQAAAAAAAAEREMRISQWEMLVDEGARDFLIQSTLVAANPASSLVNMNGGVYRVGEAVMFVGHPVRYEIVAVALDAVTLRAFDEELNAERLLRLELVGDD